MTYRVTMDFGSIELNVMVWSDTSNENVVYEKALDFLHEEGWVTPTENPIVTIEDAPEWDLD